MDVPKELGWTRTDLLLGGRRTSRDLPSNQLWGRPAPPPPQWPMSNPQPRTAWLPRVFDPNLSQGFKSSKVQLCLLHQLGSALRGYPIPIVVLSHGQASPSLSRIRPFIVDFHGRAGARTCYPHRKAESPRLRCWDPQRSLACLLTRY